MPDIVIAGLIGLFTSASFGGFLMNGDAGAPASERRVAGVVALVSAVQIASWVLGRWLLLTRRWVRAWIVLTMPMLIVALGVGVVSGIVGMITRASVSPTH